MFESSLADLCKLKSIEEELSTVNMVSIYLSGHDHFASVYAGLSVDETK